MPPAADHDYTQALNVDSQQSGSLSDHDGDCGGGQTMPPPAYGETQRVDSCGEQLGLGVQGWGETQAIDEFQETELIRSDDDEDGDGKSERTELVTDEDDDFVGEVASGIRTKDGDLVDPDASTDEEKGFCSEGKGDISSLQLTEGTCKSTDALHSSGFTAARSMTCTPVGNKSESSNLAERNFNEYNQDKVNNSHTGLKTRLMETMPCTVSDTKKDEIVLDHGTENPFRCVESYNIDSFMVQEKETTIRSEINNEKMVASMSTRMQRSCCELYFIPRTRCSVPSHCIRCCGQISFSN
ncbi:hypothetical protein KSP40_PGU021545 [Platanthera guangdongensis]|uniref:Uncharacterized protein n=1 Tax=Platanthera guangdongensis TaxID=2320717 RepID=A0ABR2LSJ9_9ASPA